MITGYYGKDGVMTQGFDSKEEATQEMNDFYTDNEFDGCYVAEHNGKWVIAYN